MIQTNHTYVNRVGINTIGVNSVNASLSRKRDNSLVDCWFFKNKTNSDADRDKVVGVKGNVLTLNNFAFSKMSGYGGFVDDFNLFNTNPAGGVIFGKTDSKITVTEVVNTTGNLEYYSNVGVGGTYNLDSYRIKVSGLPTGKVILFRYVENGVGTISELRIDGNGFYNIPAIAYTNSATTPRTVIHLLSFSSMYGMEGLNITIEQIPLYPDSLVFDGIDDWAQVIGGNLWGKTIIMRCTPLAANNILYDQRKVIQNRNFSIFTDALIAYEYGNSGLTYIDGELNTTKKGTDLIGVDQIITIVNSGSNSDTSSNFFLGKNSAGNFYGNMAIQYLAIYKEELTPEQIKSEIDKLEGDLVEPFSRYDLKEQGATNEIMRLNPVLRNLQGNSDYDIQLRNFAWALKSGVGGSSQNLSLFASTSYLKRKTPEMIRIERNTPDNNNWVWVTNISYANYNNGAPWKLNVKLEGGAKLILQTSGGEKQWSKEMYEGVNEVPIIPYSDWTHLNLSVYGATAVVTLELIPENKYGLYFDGVDDAGVCDDMMPDDFTLMAETILLNGTRDTNGLFCTNRFTADTVMGWNLQQYGANTVRIGNGIYNSYLLPSTILNANVVSSFTKDSTVITCRVNDDIFTLKGVHPLSGKDFYLGVALGDEKMERFGEMILFRLALFRPLTNYELKRAKEKYFKTEE